MTSTTPLDGDSTVSGLGGDATMNTPDSFGLFAARASYNYMADAAMKDVLGRAAEGCDWKESFNNIPMDASPLTSSPNIHLFRSMLVSRLPGSNIVKLLASASLRMLCSVGSHRFDIVDEYKGHTVWRVQSHTVDGQEPVDAVVLQTCHVFDEPNAYLVTVCSIDHPSTPCVEGWRRIHAPPSGVLVSPLPSGGPSILTLVAQVDISAMFTTLPRAHSARHTVLGLSMPLSPELLLPKGAPSLERCKEYTEPSPTSTASSSTIKPELSVTPVPANVVGTSGNGLRESMLKTHFISIVMELQTRLHALEVAMSPPQSPTHAAVNSTTSHQTTAEDQPSLPLLQLNTQQLPPLHPQQQPQGQPQLQLQTTQQGDGGRRAYHRPHLSSDASETTILQDCFVGMAVSSPVGEDARGTAPQILSSPVKSHLGIDTIPPTLNTSIPPHMTIASFGTFPGVVSPTAAGPKKKQRGGQRMTEGDGTPDSGGAGGGKLVASGTASVLTSPILSPRTRNANHAFGFDDDTDTANQEMSRSGRVSPVISPRNRGASQLQHFWGSGIGDGTGDGRHPSRHINGSSPSTGGLVLDGQSNSPGHFPNGMPRSLGPRASGFPLPVHTQVPTGYRRNPEHLTSNNGSPSVSPHTQLNGGVTFTSPYHRRSFSGPDPSPLSVLNTGNGNGGSPYHRRGANSLDANAATSPIVSSPLSMVRSPVNMVMPSDDGHESSDSARTPTISGVVPVGRACARCGVTETPKWRKDKSNPASLLYYCNACGLQMMKKTRVQGRGARANSGGSGIVSLDIPSTHGHTPTDGLAIASPIIPHTSSSGHNTPPSHTHLHTSLPDPQPHGQQQQQHAPQEASSPQSQSSKGARRFKGVPQLTVNVEGANQVNNVPAYHSGGSSSQDNATLMPPVLPPDHLSPSILMSMNFEGMEYYAPSPKARDSGTSSGAGNKFTSAVPPSRPHVTNTSPPLTTSGRVSQDGSSPAVVQTLRSSFMAADLKKRPAASPRQSSNIVVSYPVPDHSNSNNTINNAVTIDGGMGHVARRVTPRGFTERAFDAFTASPRGDVGVGGAWNFYGVDDTDMSGGSNIGGGCVTNTSGRVGELTVSGGNHTTGGNTDFSEYTGTEDIDFDLLNGLEL